MSLIAVAWAKDVLCNSPRSLLVRALPAYGCFGHLSFEPIAGASAPSPRLLQLISSSRNETNRLFGLPFCRVSPWTTTQRSSPENGLLRLSGLLVPGLP
jgi:hypothetical protein